MFFQESNNVFRRLNYNYSVEIRWIMYGNKMTLPAIRCNKSRREIESRRRIVVEFLIAFTVNTLEKRFPFQSSYELYYLVWYVSGKIIIIPRIKFECDILSKIRIVHTIKNIFQNNHRGCIKRKQKKKSINWSYNPKDNFPTVTECNGYRALFLREELVRFSWLKIISLLFIFKFWLRTCNSLQKRWDCQSFESKQSCYVYG